ncbi:MAG: LysE family translocator [Pseudomonadota bacterium]
MPLSSWSAFLFISLAATFSPGPGVLLAISTCLTLGPRRTLYSSAGNAVGVFGIAAVAVTGIGLLLRTSPTAFALLKVVGAVYLIYLGVRQWRSKKGLALPGAAAAQAATATSRSGIFVRGLLVALTNPKAILFFTAVFPQFMGAGSVDPVRFLLLTSIFVVCVLVSHLFYIVLAARLGRGTMSPVSMSYLGRLSALVFIGLGCALLLL